MRRTRRSRPRRDDVRHFDGQARAPDAPPERHLRRHGEEPRRERRARARPSEEARSGQNTIVIFTSDNGGYIGIDTQRPNGARDEQRPAAFRQRLALRRRHPRAADRSLARRDARRDEVPRAGDPDGPVSHAAPAVSCQRSAEQPADGIDLQALLNPGTKLEPRRPLLPLPPLLRDDDTRGAIRAGDWKLLSTSRTAGSSFITSRTTSAKRPISRLSCRTKPRHCSNNFTTGAPRGGAASPSPNPASTNLARSQSPRGRSPLPMKHTPTRTVARISRKSAWQAVDRPGLNQLRRLSPRRLHLTALLLAPLLTPLAAWHAADVPAKNSDIPVTAAEGRAIRPYGRCRTNPCRPAFQGGRLQPT